MEKFFTDQLSQWSAAAAAYRALKNAPCKEVACRGLQVKVQLNPKRSISTEAALDEASVAARPCFLCPPGRFPEQHEMPFEGRKGRKYDIIVNPYPILPCHTVIALKEHLPQSILNRFVDVLDLDRRFHDRVFLYNGPHSGASAPDHHHFQSAPKNQLPLEMAVRSALDGKDGAEKLEFITNVQDARLWHYNDFTNGVFVIEGSTGKSTAKMFYRLLDCAPLTDGETEPRFNLISWYDQGKWRCIVIMRTVHRPADYWAEGAERFVSSPGCADMGGCFVCVRKEDFDKLDSQRLESIMDQVTISSQTQESIIRRLTRSQKKARIRIMTGDVFTFEIICDGAGVRKASVSGGKVLYDGSVFDELYFEERTLSTMFAESSFAFHVSGKRVRYGGALQICVQDGVLAAYNIIGVEDYVYSLVSTSRKSAQVEDAAQLENMAVQARTALFEATDGLRREADAPEGYCGLGRSLDRKAMAAVDATWGKIEK